MTFQSASQVSHFQLALGGWAARWYAHIGVIRSLEERWVLPETVSGTSMGAVIAAFYAAGYTSYEMEEIISDSAVFSLVDFDLRHGVIKGKKILAFLRKHIGNRTFSDLRIPLRIVATDLKTGKKVVFSEWSVVDALRASISIPGVFSPHAHDGMSLVDGWLVENLPIEVLPEGPVLAVSVQIDLEREGRKKKIPLVLPLFANSYAILRKTIAIMIAQNEGRSVASRPDVLCLRVGKNELDYYAFHRFKELISAGKSAADAHLDTFFGPK